MYIRTWPRVKTMQRGNRPLTSPRTAMAQKIATIYVTEPLAILGQVPCSIVSWRFYIFQSSQAYLTAMLI